MKCSTLRISGASLHLTARLSLMALAASLIPAAPQALAQYVQPTHPHPPLPSSHPAAAPDALATPAVAVTPEGTWTPLANPAPETVGLMMLLTDGTVLASGNADSGLGTGGDKTWYKLTPDSQGHYVNGTWTQLTSMQYARLYVLSQILQNGKVFIAGGEYGNSPAGSGEIYDPIANTWTATPNATSLDSHLKWIDGESMLLPNGKVLSYAVGGQNCNAYGFYTGDLQIYDPVANNFKTTSCPIGNQDETSWVKLPDNSILALDLKTGGTTSIPTSAERYIPSKGEWVADAVPPVYLFNTNGELGGAFLLPNGNVFYIGGTNQTLIYTPSGTTAPGTWTQGPTFPDEGGAVVGANDAPAAMMVNGKILIAEGNYVSPCDYCTPTYFFVYDYQTNTISSINAPDGKASDTNTASYQADMLDLPDGSVLYEGNTTQLYTFTPATPQIQEGEPVINSIKSNSDGSYLLTGTGFNGISMGADYGDENQNATNYPIASLTDSSENVYYARTYNWSSTGVSTGSKVVTTDMSLPAGLPHGTYQLTVSANGIQSAPTTFEYSLAPPKATLTEDVLSFGSEKVGKSSASKVVTLKNNGGSVLNITSITLEGTNTGSFKSTNTCGSTLAVGAECKFTIYFKPTMKGQRTANVNIVDNASNSPQKIWLKGTGD
jgi:hypothetical protein